MARIVRCGLVQATCEKTQGELAEIKRLALEKHERFRSKNKFPFDLLSDEDGKACAAFGTWVEKSLYGRKYMGIERSTFLIGADRTLLAQWRKVKVAGHAEEVLAALAASTTKATTKKVKTK